MTKCCYRCGAPLGADDVGLNCKLINRGVKEFLCLACLGKQFHMTEKALCDLADRFRATGCVLFPPKPSSDGCAGETGKPASLSTSMNPQTYPVLSRGSLPEKVRESLQAVDDPARWLDWRWQMRNAFTLDDLFPADTARPADSILAVAKKYPVLLTPYWLSLALTSRAAFLQSMPDSRELTLRLEGDSDDPFSEVSAPRLPGLVQRFPDRVLVVASFACPMRCRHCTRKNLLSEHQLPSGDDWEAIRKYVLARPKVREVLISGGDPMMLDDDALVERVEFFAALPQIDAVRIGTRVPCTLPMRVTDKLAKALGRTKKVWVNTQINHASEITPLVAEACGRLVDAGIPVSCQSVLLAGVNDTVKELVDLFCGLQRIRVRPYYVFNGDPVHGTAHFRVPIDRAAELEEACAERVGGLAMPRFVRDVPGAPRKVPVYSPGL